MNRSLSKMSGSTGYKTNILDKIYPTPNANDLYYAHKFNGN